MPQERLTLSNLLNLDLGKIPVAFEEELAHVVKDCSDRPNDEKARKVAIVFNVCPIEDTGGDEVDVTVHISSSVPKRQTKPYRMISKHGGQLMFHPDLKDDPEGRTIMDEADDNRRKPE